MLKNVLVLVGLLALTACDPFEGVISVKQPMVVKSTEQSPGCSPDDPWGCNQIINVNIPVGDHSGKMDFVGRDRIQLDLKINGKKKRLTLDLPKKLDIPNNGTFHISAADLGQDFGAEGGASTNVTDSEMRSGYENCTYQRRETVCYPVNNQVVCRDEWRTVYGRQYVEYFDRRTDQNINVNFVGAAGLLATYNGGRSSNERIYRYQAQCM